jgi:tubulin---tyrosine ligase
MTEESVVSAIVFFPDAPYTASIIKDALKRLGLHIAIYETMDSIDGSTPLLQWATYDSLSHEMTLSRPRDVLTSSYVIRKSLIRKHFLHRAIQTYLTKNPLSRLNDMVPATWDVEISHSDELDEMWADELYELGQVLPEKSGDDYQHWYILKPGMADRGMGIRLFRSKHGLQRIFDSFEDSEEESRESESDQDETGIVTSQLRHFVIQVSRACFIRQTIHSNTGISS